MFRRMDDDHSHSLNFEEFFKGVKDTGLKVNKEEAEEMFKKFDMDGGGTVNIDEFLIAVRVNSH